MLIFRKIKQILVYVLQGCRKYARSSVNIVQLNFIIEVLDMNFYSFCKICVKTSWSSIMK